MQGILYLTKVPKFGVVAPTNNANKMENRKQNKIPNRINRISRRHTNVNKKILHKPIVRKSVVSFNKKLDIKETIKGMLSTFHEIDLDYMALPANVWESVSAEFLQEWRKDKHRQIKLTPISHPGLKEIKLQTQKTDTFTPDSVKEAMQLFGRENVKVRRGEKK